jgi:hypothetical protein
VIHGDGFPRLTRGRKQSIEAFLLDGRFGNGTGSAGSDVLPDILSKVWPIEILFQYCHYFLDPEIPSDLTIVIQIGLVENWPIRSLMPTRVEYSGYRHDRWLAEAVCNIVGVSLLVLDVQIKLL